MKKDAYYFPHYSNARNDRKLQHIRRVFGSQGYGIYFMILEILREQTNFKYPLSGIDDLSFDLREPKEIILSIINDFDLFTVDKTNNFFSSKLIFYLQPYLEKSQRARKAAEIRWSNANAYANALPQHSKSNAKADASKGKETKVKESKEVNITPSQFYKTELLTHKDSMLIDKYRLFHDLLFGKNDLDRELTEVLRIPGQVSYNQFCKLYKKSVNKKKKFSQMLMTMVNKSKYYAKNKSLYLTLNTWLNNDFK